jgi:peptidoglycan-N-acetylglucosamine deacetylase
MVARLRHYLARCRSDRRAFLNKQAGAVATLVSAGWPSNASGAVSLAYDDALPCHLSRVAPALKASNLHGTFYVNVDAAKFLDDCERWAGIAAEGHELGNHTIFHPCRNRKLVGRGLNLRAYTEHRWRSEVKIANWILTRIDGRSDRTFGNTCWDNWLGPIGARLCLEPLARDYFVAARGELRESAVDPRAINFFNLGTRCGDGLTFDAIVAMIDEAIRTSCWLILTFHGVGEGTHISFVADKVHGELLRWLDTQRSRIWTAPVREIASYLHTFHDNKPPGLVRNE